MPDFDDDLDYDRVFDYDREYDRVYDVDCEQDVRRDCFSGALAELDRGRVVYDGFDDLLVGRPPLCELLGEQRRLDAVYIAPHVDGLRLDPTRFDQAHTDIHFSGGELHHHIIYYDADICEELRESARALLLPRGGPLPRRSPWRCVHAFVCLWPRLRRQCRVRRRLVASRGLVRAAWRKDRAGHSAARELGAAARPRRRRWRLGGGARGGAGGRDGGGVGRWPGHRDVGDVASQRGAAQARGDLGFVVSRRLSDHQLERRRRRKARDLRARIGGGAACGAVHAPRRLRDHRGVPVPRAGVAVAGLGPLRGDLRPAAFRRLLLGASAGLRGPRGDSGDEPRLSRLRIAVGELLHFAGAVAVRRRGRPRRRRGADRRRVSSQRLVAGEAGRTGERRQAVE
mmetsp:Transcript_132142/g.382028  ORF Transcript_132142/g.382028 Transcript_132142/m.382028 type:complete len:399 (+) Transcript_132142:547-1743(+)